MGTKKGEVTTFTLAYKAVRDATVLNGDLTHAEGIAVLQVVLQEASVDALRIIYKDNMLEKD